MKFGMEVIFGGIHLKWTDGVAGPKHSTNLPKTSPIANFSNFGPIWLKIGGEV